MKEAAYSAPKLKAEINENQLKHFKKVEGESYFGPQIFLPSLTEAEKKPERCSLKERSIKGAAFTIFLFPLSRKLLHCLSAFVMITHL